MHLHTIYTLDFFADSKWGMPFGPQCLPLKRPLMQRFAKETGHETMHGLPWNCVLHSQVLHNVPKGLPLRMLCFCSQSWMGLNASAPRRDWAVQHRVQSRYVQGLHNACILTGRWPMESFRSRNQNGIFDVFQNPSQHACVGLWYLQHFNLVLATR